MIPLAVRSKARRVAAAGLGRPSVVRALTRGPASRGDGLALLWHRVGPPVPGPRVLPTVPVERFDAQIAALVSAFDVVPLDHLADPPSQTGRARVALTFDDDDAGHADHSLPVLQRHGVTATFFLSGRWLHGYGPYWWEVLEAQAAADGVEAVARRHGSAARYLPALAAELEGTDRSLALKGDGPPPMDAGHAARLADAGMTIGFHTVDHPALPTLRGHDLDHAVRFGRDRLADALGVAITALAYPHGKHDPQVRMATRAAGYDHAWVTSHRATGAQDDPWARGRWEPGDRNPQALLVGAARRLRLGTPGATGRRHR